MVLKFFRFDAQRHDKPSAKLVDFKLLHGMTASQNISSVAVPKFRVRGDFVEYVVECSKQGRRWRVFRRYQQFRALDQKLKQLCTLGSQNHCEYGVLPVLSGSHWTEVTNQSIDLVEKRRRYLEIYLEQLLVSRNLFYVAKTALYDFLHDGEVPVQHKTNVTRPLIGFSTLEPSLQEKRPQQEKKKKEEDKMTALPAEETPVRRVRGAPVGSVYNNNHSSPSHSVHTADHETSQKTDLAPFGLFLVNAVDVTKDGAEDDAASEEDTDNEDVRRPRPSPLCLHCNAEFSSVLYPHKCYLCKQRFCRNCLRPLGLDDEVVVRACVQCYGNYERHMREGPGGKDLFSGTSCMQPGDFSHSTDLFPLSGESQVRTDVSLCDFQLVTTLGRGAFGKVIKVIFREDGKVYAMKVMNKCVLYKRRMIDCVKEEKNIMTALPPHPYVVTCHFAFQTDYHVFFVLDYLPGGELYSHIYPRCTFSPSEIRLIIAELVLALEHLHRYDVVHRDVKPENIVMGADGHLKLTDFGLARMNFSRKRRCSFVGSPEYLAPETIQGEDQTRALDWWSVGVMLYEMLKGSPPFHAANNHDVYKNVLGGPLDLTAACFTPEAASLIQQLLQRQPAQRLSDAGRIKSHPYFASVDWAALESKALPPPVRIDLDGNDTRYFKREFTAEWAVIVKSQDVSRATLDALTSRFSNFVHVSDVEVDGSLLEGQPSSLSWEENGSGALNVQNLFGVWRIVKVEMETSDGKVAYPWGSDVCGLLAYFPDGLYTMQLTAAQRPCLPDDIAPELTNGEIAEVYNSYVSSFGKYHVNAGSNIVFCCPSGSLCPALTGRTEKYFAELRDGSETGGAAVLKLSTALYALQEEKLLARTILTWERVTSG